MPPTQAIAALVPVVDHPVSRARPEQQSGRTETPERPALAPGVALVGQMHGTGFVEDPWLIQRDGRFIQVSELLYRFAELADGTRTVEEIAAALTDATEWVVSATLVRQAIETKFIPLGLIADTDGTAMASVARPAGSPLGINMRVKTLGPGVIDPISAVLQALFVPPVIAAVMVAVVIAEGLLFASGDVAAGIRAALFMPGFLPLTLLVLAAGSAVQEFGHAAALRYGGGKVRGMGVGIYLVYPMLYTDVTDSYRLGRGARLRTDLGGVYFHMIFALVVTSLYWVTGHEALIFVVLLINAQVVGQFLPFVRFDGYWILADLTGVPDFFSQMGPFIRSSLPKASSRGSRLPRLKPWVRVVFASYVLVTVPLLAFLFVLMIKNLPSFVTTVWDALLFQRMLFADARVEGDGLTMVGAVLQALLLVVQLVGVAYILFGVARIPLRLLSSWSRGRRSPRLAPVLGIGGAALLLLGLFWTPDLPFAGDTAPKGVERFAVADRLHVADVVDYSQVPPVGGNHAPIWQNCGFYDAPVPNERAVHSLEHGAVWITFRPDLPDEQVAVLRQVAGRHTHVLVSPVDGLPAPVVASAWGRQLRLESAGDPRLDQFVATYQLGPQAPEPGGPCGGGEGVPS